MDTPAVLQRVDLCVIALRTKVLAGVDLAAVALFALPVLVIQVTSGQSPSIRGAPGFVAGFTMVFTALGATASALGAVLYAQLDIALTVAGVVPSSSPPIGSRAPDF